MKIYTNVISLYRLSLLSIFICLATTSHYGSDTPLNLKTRNAVLEKCFQKLKATISETHGNHGNQGNQGTANISDNDKIHEKISKYLEKQTANSDFATFYGGIEADRITAVALSRFGQIIVAGYTDSKGSISFNGQFSTSLGGTDAFIARFDNNGRRRWATYFGGNSIDVIHGIAIDDNASNIVVAGQTNSFNLPTDINSHQRGFNGGDSDGFLAKFSLFNGDLEYCTYYGGSGDDAITDAAFDEFDNMVAVGYTTSTTDIAANGNILQIQGEFDGMIALFTPDGDRLWGSYAGGNDIDLFNVVETDGVNIHVGGSVSSIGIGLGIQLQSGYGGGDWDAWLQTYRRDGTLVRSSYYGGTGQEEITGLEIRNSELAFCGFSNSSNLPMTFNLIPGIGNDANAFIAKTNAAGLDWTRVYYGPSNDQAFGISSVRDGFVIVGTSNSITNIAPKNAYQQMPGGRLDAFYSVIDSDGEVLLMSYLGADSVDVGYAIDATPDEIVIAGYTWEDDFFNKQAHQPSAREDSDGYIVKYQIPSLLGPTIILTADSVLCPGTQESANIRLNNSPNPQMIETYLQNLSGQGDILLSVDQVTDTLNITFDMPADLEGRYRIYSTFGNIESNKIILAPDYFSDFEISGEDGVLSDTICGVGSLPVMVQRKNGYNYKWSLGWYGTDLGDENPIVTISNFDIDKIQDSLTISVDITLAGRENCIQTVTRTLYVDPPEDITISGPDEVCLNQPTEFSINIPDDWQLQWWNPINGSVIGDTSATVNVVFLAEGNLYARVINTASGCEYTFEKELDLVLPPMLSFNGVDATCSTCEETYSYATNAEGISFDIELGTITSQTDSTLTVQWAGPGDGKIIINLTQADCIFSQEYPVNLSDDAPLTISGREEACIGASSQYFTFNSPDYEYQWELDTGGEISDAITSKPTVIWDMAGVHTLTVNRTNTITQTEETDSIVVTIYATPDVSGYTFREPLCHLNFGYIDIDVNYPDNTEFDLEIGDLNVEIRFVGQNGIEFTVDSFGVYSYTLTATNSICTDTLTGSVEIRQTPDITEIETIDDEKGLRATQIGDDYEWQLQTADSHITVSNERDFYPQESGFYRVFIFRNGCRSEASEYYEFFFTSVNSANRGIVWYNDDNNTLILPESNPGTQIDIYDITGKLIKTQAGEKNTIKLYLQPGIYFYALQNGAENESGKFIVR
jgi:hypothetical protein